jgi:hypothetical protein
VKRGTATFCASLTRPTWHRSVKPEVRLLIRYRLRGPVVDGLGRAPAWIGVQRPANDHARRRYPLCDNRRHDDRREGTALSLINRLTVHAGQSALANAGKLLDAHPALAQLRLVQQVPYGSRVAMGGADPDTAPDQD